MKEKFNQAAVANLKIQEINQKLKYHQIKDYQIIKSYSKPEMATYKVEANLIVNQAVITGLEQQARRFILATNLLDRQQLNTDEILTVYK